MQTFFRQPGVDLPASSASLTKAAWASSTLSVQVLQIVIRASPRVPRAQGFGRSMCKIQRIDCAQFARAGAGRRIELQ